MTSARVPGLVGPQVVRGGVPETHEHRQEPVDEHPHRTTMTTTTTDDQELDVSPPAVHELGGR